MSKAFLQHLSLALGAAPDATTAERIIEMALRFPEPREGWSLVRAVQEAAEQRHGVSVFSVLDRHDLLAQDDVADAVGKHAALQGNKALLEAWSKHPQAKAVAAGARGARILDACLRQGLMGVRTDEKKCVNAVKSLLGLDLPWPKSTLEMVARNAMTSREMTVESRLVLASAAVRAGANPAAIESGVERSKPAALLFVHNAHLFAPSQRDFLRLLADCPDWDEVLGLRDKGRSFAALAARNCPAEDLATALDKGKERWWDGDPYGLVDVIVQNAHREPALLVAMCARAQRDPPRQGLSSASTIKLFSALFNSSGKQANQSATRAQFWASSAPRMASLWTCGDVWTALCERACAFEKEGSAVSPEQRQAFLESVLLEVQTPQAPSRGSRRTL